ncbi:MAG: hypothetical protein ACREP5_08850, partial [Candidatus Binatia bacterium]
VAGYGAHGSKGFFVPSRREYSQIPAGRKVSCKKTGRVLASFSVRRSRICQPFTQAGDCVNLPAT